MSDHVESLANASRTSHAHVRGAAGFLPSLPSCLQPPLLPVSGRVGGTEGKGAPCRRPARTCPKRDRSRVGERLLRHQAAVRETEAVYVEPRAQQISV